MTVNELKNLTYRKSNITELFEGSTGFTIDINTNEFIGLYVDDSGDWNELNRYKHLEDCIEDLIKWRNHEI